MPYRLGDVRVDDRAWTLHRSGARVPVEPKVFRLLLLLLEHRDRVVTKREILDSLWGDAAVTEASLTRALSLARKVLGDSAHAQRWIRTEARIGYRFVGPVEVLADDDAPRSPRLGSDPFIGREATLGALDAAWSAARSGTGRGVVLTGEPGIGKTRTARELAERIRGDAGAQAIYTWCSREPDAPPYWPWVQLLRAIEAAEDDGPALLESLAPGAARSPGLAFSAEAERFGILDRLVRSVRASSPLLWVLDDLQWADRSSLDALGFLAHELGSMSLLVVATCRSDALGEQGPLSETLATLLRAPGGCYLDLEALSAADVARYVEAIGGPAAMAATLFERSRGNPLFLRELARAMLSSGPHGTGGQALPPSLRGVIEERLGTLPPAVREILEWAALAGRVFEVSVLARASRRPVPEVADAIDRAARAEIVAAERSSGRFAFSHDLIREGLRRGQRAAVIARRHRALAETLDAGPAARTGAEAEVAHHYMEALRGGEVCAATVPALLRAAERAAAGLAYDEALQGYERALEAYALLGGASAHQTLAVLLAIGPLHWRMNRFREAVDVAERAAALARELDDTEAFARAALLMWPRTRPLDNPRGRVLLQEAHTRLQGTTSPLRGEVLARLAFHHYMEDEDPRLLLPMYDEALDLVRDAEAPVAAAWVLYSMLVSCWGAIDPGDRRAMVEELAALAWAGGGSDVVNASQLRITQLLEDGRVAEADDEIARVERHLEQQASQTYTGWYSPFYRGMRALMSGELEVAEGLMRAAAEAGRVTNALDEERAVGAQLVQLRIDQGRAAEIEGILRWQLERQPREPSLAPLHAYVLCELQREEEARPRFERAVEAYDPGRDPNRSITLTILANACARLGDRERGERLVHLLEPLADRIAVNLTAWICQGSLQWPLGQLAALLGRRKEARRRLESAVLVNQRLGARVYWNRARLDLAALLAEGSPDERRHACELLDAVVQDARSGGYGALERRAEALRSRL